MFQKLLAGRYGTDTLSITILIIAMLLYGPRILPLRIAAAVIAAYAVYRIFSKNHEKRRAELQKFNAVTSKLKSFFMGAAYRTSNAAGSATTWSQRRRERAADRKTHKFVKCPNCKNTLRLPRGKGKLHVTCPVCKHEFDKKT